MIKIAIATIDDIKTIQTIAKKTWPVTYGEILSQEQLHYMLDKMYSDDVLKDNLTNKGHHFILAKENDVCLGFASFEFNYMSTNATRLHKLYLLPSAQGKGVGKKLVDAIVEKAQKNHSTSLSLNVNRFNKAVSFYKKVGFEIIAEEDLDIGDGYFMEDYKMELKI